MVWKAREMACFWLLNIFLLQNVCAAVVDVRQQSFAPLDHAKDKSIYLPSFLSRKESTPVANLIFCKCAYLPPHLYRWSIIWTGSEINARLHVGLCSLKCKVLQSVLINVCCSHHYTTKLSVVLTVSLAFILWPFSCAGIYLASRPDFFYKNI